jgi:arylsulfatase A-like enzyme
MKPVHLILAFLGASLLAACYPLSTGAMKWRIKWDKDKKAGKEFFMEAAREPKLNAPNIILIVADDLGRYDVSAYDGVDHIETPHIDQLGKEGVIFEHAYVTAPTCAPSRAGLMTGRLQNRYGFETQLMEFYPTNMVEYISGKYITDTDSWVLETKPRYPREWQIARQGVPPTEINLAEFLQSAGYSTGITGKWHLGNSRDHIPLERGFDYHYGFLGAFSLYTPEKNQSGVINHEHNTFSDKHQWDNGRIGDGRIMLNGKIVREEDYLTFAIRDHAIDYIQAHKDSAFFLYCAFSAPHVPFQALVDYYCAYSHVEDENKRVYYAMISALDDAIGAIHQAVKDAGIEDNTIIYFISDNGGAAYTHATDNGPLKGGKLMQFEGGIRVPFMMKWKGSIPPGTRYQPAVSSTDIFATTAAACGIGLPQDRIYDGVDLLPFILGEQEGNPHEQLFWRADHIWAVRDGAYKLILSTRDGWAELYHVEEDISESIDLADEMPELLEAIRKKHEAWQQELPEKYLWPRIMDHKFVIDGKEYLFPA